MDDRLRELIDHHEIKKTLSEYCHGCDRCDATRMGGVYTDESWDDHGMVKAPGQEFARIMTGRILAESVSLSHMLGQSQIRIYGDTAGAETYFLAVQRTKDEGGAESCHQMGGRYIDRLEREGDRWLIKHRQLVRDWSLSVPVEADWLADAGITPGERSNADPSFAALGITHSGTR